MHGVPPRCLAVSTSFALPSVRLAHYTLVPSDRVGDPSSTSSRYFGKAHALNGLGTDPRRPRRYLVPRDLRQPVGLHCSARGVCLYTTTRHTAALEYQNYGIPATPTRRCEAAPPTAQRHAASKSHPSEDQTVGRRPLRVSDIGTHSFRHQAADLIPLQRARRALSVLPHRAPHCTGTAPFP